MRFLAQVVIVWLWNLTLGGLAMADSATELRIAATAVTSHFHPSLMRGKDDVYLRDLIHGRLIDADEQWQFRCKFCERVPGFPVTKGKTEKSPRLKPEKAITWKILKTAKWGNGVSINGWDVRFSFEIAQASRLLSGSPPRSVIRSILVNDQDASEFTVHLESLTSDYIIDLDFPLLPAAIEEPIWISAEKNIDRYLNASEYEKNPFNPALYSGCYLPTNRQVDGVILQPNKHCIEPAQFSSIRTVVERRNWREVMNLGSVDIIPEGLVSDEQAAALAPLFAGKGDLAERWNLEATSDGSIEFLMFNLRNPAFADRKVRQALAMSIDSAKLANVGLPLTEPPPGVFPRALVGAAKMQWPYATNVTEAQNIFKQMRWLRENKGLLHRDGKPMSFELAVSSVPPSRQALGQDLASMFAAVGVELKVKVIDDQTFRRSTIGRSNFSDLILVRWHFQPALIPFSILHSSQIPGVENDYRGQNIGGIFSKKIDDQLVRWAEEMDPNAQLRMREEISRLFAEEIYAIPLLQGSQVAFVSKAIKGFRLTGHQRPSSSTVQEWHFAQEVKP